MKKTFSMILILALVIINLPMGSTVKAESKFDGYIAISTPEDLANIANDNTGKYYLTKDIDMESYGYWEPMQVFAGVLDGNGHVIKNLSISSASKVDVYGMFISLFGATVKNLSLANISYNINKETENSDLESFYVGGLTGYARNSVIENLKISGKMKVSISSEYNLRDVDDTVNGINYVGGIIGCSFAENKISNCYTNLDMDSSYYYNMSTYYEKKSLSVDNYVGGIVGVIEDSTIIENSFTMGRGTMGAVIVDLFYQKYVRNHALSMENNIGGIVGKVEGELSEIRDCFNVSNVGGTAGYTAYDVLKKSVVYNDEEIDLSTLNYVGGISGYLNSKLSNCYSSGEIFTDKGDTAGGVVGYADAKAYIYGAYYLRNENQKNKFNSGLSGVGDDTKSAKTEVVSLDHTKIQEQKSFKNLDFTSKWQIVKGVNDGYPIHKKNTKAFQLSKGKVSMKAGTYKKGIAIKLYSATPGTKIYYTTNGTKPTTKSKVYTNKIQINKSTTLKILVTRNGFKNSSVATYKYVIKNR